MDTTDDVAAIGRDADALEAFYRSHVEAVQRFVARRVTDVEDAADLTAEIFLAAIDASSRYRGDAAAPRAWLYGIARLVVAGHHRSSARTLQMTRRIDAREPLDDDATERIVARLDSERDARRLYESLAALPEPQRAVVELVAVDGLSLTEAAGALGITAGNARVRFHRARRTLARELSPSLANSHEVTT